MKKQWWMMIHATSKMSSQPTPRFEAKRRIVVRHIRRRLLDEDNLVVASKSLIIDGIKMKHGGDYWEHGLVWDDGPEHCSIRHVQEKAISSELIGIRVYIFEEKT
jgi:hypothetical protein